MYTDALVETWLLVLGTTRVLYWYCWQPEFVLYHTDLKFAVPQISDLYTIYKLNIFI